MTRVLVIGGTSLVGSHFVANSRHEIWAAGRRNPEELGARVARFQHLDVTDGNEVDSVIDATPAELVVNFAAATDVGAVERERALGESPGTPANAWALNALAPGRMAAACGRSGRRFITFSTDFVFDGSSGPYGEQAAPAKSSELVSWYGWTKAVGERNVAEANAQATVIRISYPFRSEFAFKDDFARRILRWRSQGRMPPLFVDQTLTPTWIPDVTNALDFLVDTAMTGTVHVASPTRTTPYEFGTELLQSLEGNAPTLERGDARSAMHAAGSYLRPLKGGLRCERLASQGVPLTPWDVAVHALVRQIRSQGGG